MKMSTPISSLTEGIEEQMEAFRQTLISRMELIGLQAVNEARQYNGKQYTDRTNNLRSSTGFVLVVDGQVQGASGFETCGSGEDGDGATGSTSGKAYAQELASRFPQGVALIVVAGMEYAAFVQNKGYNVLDSAQILATDEIKKLIKEVELW